MRKDDDSLMFSKKEIHKIAPNYLGVRECINPDTPCYTNTQAKLQVKPLYYTLPDYTSLRAIPGV